MRSATPKWEWIGPRSRENVAPSFYHCSQGSHVWHTSMTGKQLRCVSNRKEKFFMLCLSVAKLSKWMQGVVAINQQPAANLGEVEFASAVLIVCHRAFWVNRISLIGQQWHCKGSERHAPRARSIIPDDPHLKIPGFITNVYSPVHF